MSLVLHWAQPARAGSFFSFDQHYRTWSCLASFLVPTRLHQAWLFQLGTCHRKFLNCHCFTHGWRSARKQQQSQSIFNRVPRLINLQCSQASNSWAAHPPSKILSLIRFEPLTSLEDLEGEWRWDIPGSLLVLPSLRVPVLPVLPALQLNAFPAFPAFLSLSHLSLSMGSDTARPLLTWDWTPRRAFAATPERTLGRKTSPRGQTFTSFHMQMPPPQSALLVGCSESSLSILSISLRHFNSWVQKKLVYKARKSRKQNAWAQFICPLKIFKTF